MLSDRGDTPGTFPRIEGFTILRVLGVGGMGVVYEALQHEPERRVALKIMKTGVASPDALRRFRREVQALGKIHHPGVARIYQVGIFELASGDPRLPRLSLLSGTVAERDERYGLTRIAHPAGAIWLTGLLDAGREARVAIRSTDVALATARPAQLSVRTVLEGTVETIEADGPSASVTLVLKGDGRLVASLTRKSADELSLAAGRNVFALVKSVALDN